MLRISALLVLLPSFIQASPVQPQHAQPFRRQEPIRPWRRFDNTTTAASFSSVASTDTTFSVSADITSTFSTDLSSIESTFSTDVFSTDATLTTDTVVSTGAGSALSESTPFSTESYEAIPTYDAPTSTVISDAQVTTEAEEIAPLFLWLWSQRDLIDNPQRKQEYIDNVKKVDDEVNSLFKSLDVQPISEPECDKTALKRWIVSSQQARNALVNRRAFVKRSFISGILGELDSAAKLLSCATDIIGNLVDAVEEPTPSITEIENLTDSLKDIVDEIEDEEKPSSISNSGSSTTASASCTGGSAVPVCTETISVFTQFSVDGTQTASTVETITTTVCQTVTGCSIDATTAFTTIETASTTASSAWVCGTQCASCSSSLEKRADGEVFPMADLEDWRTEEDDYFTQRRKNGENIQQLDWNIIDTTNPYSTQAISMTRDFAEEPHVTWVDGITGCTVLTVLSDKGLWFAHLFEGGFIAKNDIDREKWNRIVQYATNGGPRFVVPSSLAGEGGILNTANNVKIYVQTPAVGTLKVNPNNKEARYLDKINELSSILFGVGTPFEGIMVNVNTYYKPEDFDPNASEDDSPEAQIARAENTARFKAMIEYSPDFVNFDYETCNEFTAKTRRLWEEKSPIFQYYWDVQGNAPANRRRQACSIRPSFISGLSTAGPATDTGGLSLTASATVTNSVNSARASATVNDSFTTIVTTPTQVSTSIFMTPTATPLSTTTEEPTTSLPPTTEAPSTTEASSTTDATTSSEAPTTVEEPTTTSPPAVPTTPLIRQDIVCNNEADFPGHADISGSAQDQFSTDFSGIIPDDGYDLYDGAPDIVLSTDDSHGVSYYYSASWLSGCVTTEASQDFRFPLGIGSEITAYLNVREDYTKCNNGGVGGSVQVGCIVYTFTGGK